MWPWLFCSLHKAECIAGTIAGLSQRVHRVTDYGAFWQLTEATVAILFTEFLLPFPAGLLLAPTSIMASGG